MMEMVVTILGMESLEEDFFLFSSLSEDASLF